MYVLAGSVRQHDHGLMHERFCISYTLRAAWYESIWTLQHFTVTVVYHDFNFRITWLDKEPK